MYGHQHYMGESIDRPELVHVHYHIEQLYRAAERHRLIREARAGHTNDPSHVATALRRFVRRCGTALRSSTRSAQRST